MAKNQTSFKPGYDARRHVFYKGNGLTVYNDKLGLMLRKQIEPALVSKYMHSVLINTDNPHELRVKVAIDILNRREGKALPMDRLYDLNKQIEADKGLHSFSDDEIEEKIDLLQDELRSRRRVEIILNDYAKQSE